MAGLRGGRRSPQQPGGDEGGGGRYAAPTASCGARTARRNAPPSTVSRTIYHGELVIRAHVRPSRAPFCARAGPERGFPKIQARSCPVRTRWGSGASGRLSGQARDKSVGAVGRRTGPRAAAAPLDRLVDGVAWPVHRVPTSPSPPRLTAASAARFASVVTGAEQLGGEHGHRQPARHRPRGCVASRCRGARSAGHPAAPSCASASARV